MNQLPESSEGDYFESFIQYIEEVGNINISDKVNLVNLNIYNTYRKISDSAIFLREMGKKYDTIQVAQHGWIEESITKYSKKIQTGEYNIIPGFGIDINDTKDEKKLLFICIIKKKDKIDIIKKGIKKLSDKLIPSTTVTE